MLNNYEKVHYVICISTGQRVSKFYSKRGLADNYLKKLKKYSDDYESVTMYCVPLIDAVL